MKLIFVNIMHDLYNLDSTANISQPPVPLGVLNSVTPNTIETALIDEQTDKVRYDGDVFAFTLATQFTGKAYRYADDLRAAGLAVDRVSVTDDPSVDRVLAKVDGDHRVTGIAVGGGCGEPDQ